VGSEKKFNSKEIFEFCKEIQEVLKKHDITVYGYMADVNHITCDKCLKNL
jgi:hypothetical protein